MTLEPNTVLWWLLRIEDKELRERAVRACAWPDKVFGSLEDAIWSMCSWDDTEEYGEGICFWYEISEQAQKNLIPLLPVSCTEPAVSVTEQSSDTEGKKSDAIDFAEWTQKKDFFMLDDNFWMQFGLKQKYTSEQLYELYKNKP